MTRAGLGQIDFWASVLRLETDTTRSGEGRSFPFSDLAEAVIRPRPLGRTPHGFRRTAARNFIWAGVPQHVVGQLCDWKTDAMFRRYAIMDERDLRSAAEVLARCTTGQAAG